MQFVFIECQIEGNRNILKLNCGPLAFISYKAFIENKNRSRTRLPDSFSAWFLKKNIYLVIYSITWPNFIVSLPLLREIKGIMCIAIVCSPVCDVLNFEINFLINLSNQTVFSTWPKSQDKNLNILRKEKAFKMK